MAIPAGRTSPRIGIGRIGRVGDENGEGFNRGRVARPGVARFAGERSGFTADQECAGASRQCDNRKNGRIHSSSLRSETHPGTAAPLMATYGLRNDQIEATTQDDVIQEVTFGVGIKFPFAADTPRQAAGVGRSMAMPQLQGRASPWTARIG